MRHNFRNLKIYKRAIDYSIELYKSNIEFLGSLKIQFRTQSEVLINVLDSFFELWIKLETKHIHPFLKSKKIIYSIDINKFERSLLNPDKNFENKLFSGKFNTLEIDKFLFAIQKIYPIKIVKSENKITVN